MEEAARNKINLGIYAFLHFMVDFVCVYTVCALTRAQNAPVAAEAYRYIMLYNFMAFALQPFTGLVQDKSLPPRLWALIGCVAVASGAFLGNASVRLSILLVGLGNALFHVGGGMAALDMARGRASEPGIFVALGAVGLGLGSMLGAMHVFPFLLVGIMMLLSSLLLLAAKDVRPYINRAAIKTIPSKTLVIAFVLVLCSIFIRAFAGYEFDLSWKQGSLPIIAFSCCVAFGKVIGGIVADKIGFTPAACGGLLLSMPLVLLCNGNMILSLVGVILFNMTMPVTLAAITRIFPGRRGMAFGMAAAMLLPGLLLSNGLQLGEGGLASIMLLGAIAIFISNAILYGAGALRGKRRE